MTYDADPLRNADGTCTVLLRRLAISADRLRALADAGDWEGVADEARHNNTVFERLTGVLAAASLHERQTLSPLVSEVIDKNRLVTAQIAPRLKDIGQLLDELSGR